MDDFEEISKQKIFGLHGEFTVGSGAGQLRALYIETKIRPGSDGVWDNVLASQLVPWREIFDIEKVTFDELLQRDLNDSRVAHDLIPYLIGTSSSAARFFPPILVVLVPKRKEGTGIEKLYPAVTETDAVTRAGDLFEFVRNANASGGLTPYGRLEFNPQRSAFIIVDGQHRAMAVLALHRQLTNSWNNSNYEAYYKHIQVTPADVRKLELPVCIVVFPDLQDGSAQALSGATLDKACRELFLTVNRKAQTVSQARNLLLDDNDFAALMMRRTLSKFKGRTEAQDTLARIYSFRYSDSDDEGKAVQAGKLEYSSAVFLHKLHCIGSFGNPKGFVLHEPAELSSGLQHRNPDRPAEILMGTDLERWNKLTRVSAKAYAPADVDMAVDLLGGLVDHVMLALFDTFGPFAAHNRAMRQLRTRLSEPSMRADAIQNKVFSLLFEGSGSKEVFEEHIERLASVKREWTDEGRPVSDYVVNQLNDAIAVQKALQRHETDLKRQRACHLFNVRYDRFYPDPAAESAGEQQKLDQRSRSIFDAISTQAFQIGYLVAVLTLVETSLPDDAAYALRRSRVEAATELVLTALNEFLRPGTVRHETFAGLAATERVAIFSTDLPGLRALLGLSVSELNEKQWSFFRYAIYEVLFSKHARKAVAAWVVQRSDVDREVWTRVLSELAAAMEDLRNDYIGRALRVALRQNDFVDAQRTKRAEMGGGGKAPDEIEATLRDLEEAERLRVYELARTYIVASAGELNGPQALLKLLSRSPAATQVEETAALAEPEGEGIPDLAEIEKAASDSAADDGFAEPPLEDVGVPES